MRPRAFGAIRPTTCKSPSHWKQALLCRRPSSSRPVKRSRWILAPESTWNAPEQEWLFGLGITLAYVSQRGRQLSPRLAPLLFSHEGFGSRLEPSLSPFDIVSPNHRPSPCPESHRDRR